MEFVERAYEGLVGKKPDRRLEISYSRRFNPYNANVKYNNRRIALGFSHLWEDVDEEIQVGLAQHLLRKALNIEGTTDNIRLYERFLEKIPKYIEHADDAPEDLEESFTRVNEEYFDGLMEKPGLEWGQRSVSNLGRYAYRTDTVRISTLFRDLPEDKRWMLDFIMYHELLHKRFGIKRHDNGRKSYHTPEFREWEARFKVEDAEKRLNKHVKRARLRNIFK